MTTDPEDAQDASRRLAVRRLTLTDFRCYPFLRLEADPRPVVLTGANGAGKTNLLEALSFLTPGRGMRRATLSEVARREAQDGAPWAVAAVLDGPGGPVEIGTGREPGSERRTVRIGGSPAKARELDGIASALWLTPAMDRLFTEGAGGRRRFLDRLVFGQDHGHAAAAAAYEHAMRERTRLLKAGGGDAAWLTALEDAMARHGATMAAARNAAVARLDAACAEAVGPFPAARLALAGEVEGWTAEGGAAAAEDRLRAALFRARARDEAAGAATIGPHRTDLAVRHAGRDLPAGQCSTGEQKAVLVSIVLAQARVRTALSGLAPLLLLDEVAAHLDATRRAALYDVLSGLNAQSWMTGTDERTFESFGERAQYFRVESATVVKNDFLPTDEHR
ncbi:DNA replication/repair protein RecF [Magnetospirillum sp. UT-4]|uniref:DNA replication/repair protein RecF n=1 Tax=Magnetospirillum sp. UT-4 TaxID=2681467 RepID=UPI001381C226|nr:DNA replication/repair protein RecF [Magnetospirillum sp. UT-4]CAA7611575.1 DNA replication and repair protein RecF [Magnetospirillum sp. UT-4]